MFGTFGVLAIGFLVLYFVGMAMLMVHLMGKSAATNNFSSSTKNEVKSVNDELADWESEEDSLDMKKKPLFVNTNHRKVNLDDFTSYSYSKTFSPQNMFNND
ncbi:hypothetical protein [Hydrogenovibrio marinus]|uniref:Uncharacterized protein n=1 Tax=Hydrogenovibrio marinus TaxID=28885 RepID=A0A066ZXC0_HYDMR|nr:hypothetical protein [Hydrogenovibrio marinus]KDN94720.1 hypothetical protein EI16_12550 [Hydrogenovibrio marinus]